MRANQPTTNTMKKTRTALEAKRDRYDAERKEQAFARAKVQCDEDARKYFGISVSELRATVDRRDETIRKLKIEVDLLRATCDRFAGTTNELRGMMKVGQLGKLS